MLYLKVIEFIKNTLLKSSSGDADLTSSFIFLLFILLALSFVHTFCGGGPFSW